MSDKNIKSQHIETNLMLTTSLTTPVISVIVGGALKDPLLTPV